MTSKYSPLEHYLKNQTADVRELTLTFKKIEEILCAKLPKSAYQYSAWWNNEIDGTHVQARGWMGAGWRVETVNKSQCWVYLHKMDR